MKKLSLYIFLVLMFSNIAQTSDRPLCDVGVDYTNWSNCFGSYESSEGRIYTGEFGDNPGKRDGIGKTELNGSLFLGEFKNDLPKGKGVIIYPDGSITSGEMNGFPNGQIILKISIDNKKKNFDRHFGEVKNGIPDGFGVRVFSNGKVVKGIFKKGKLVEDQSLKECDRNKSFKTYNNCQLVYAIVHSVDGSKYGDDRDKFKGFIYSGEFQNGMPNGYGLTISQMPNDQRIEYFGEVKNGNRNGVGSLYYIDLEYEYIGNFKNGVVHGDVIFIMNKEKEDKLIRFGNWIKGKEHGKGFVIDLEAPIMWRDEYNNGVRISAN